MITATPTTQKNETFAKRGRADFFSTNLKIALHNANTDSLIRHRYLYSTFCNKELTKEGDKITGKYCGQRWCVTCNRIRTAQLINAYLPEVQSIKEPRFITLTLKNCTAEELRPRVQWMVKAWAKIQKKLARNKEVKGYRKLEVTHNQRFNDFHPHFHAIVEGKGNAEYIISAWLNLCQDANIEALAQWQDERPADLDSMKELFKYTTKILPKKPKGKTWEEVFTDNSRVQKFLQGQDQIYQALYRVKTFQPFGFKPATETKEEEERLEVEAQETKLNIPDGTYLRNGRGNWEHTIFDNKIHNRELGEEVIRLVNLMGGNFIRKLRI
jgi:hypothetical protein